MSYEILFEDHKKSTSLDLVELQKKLQFTYLAQLCVLKAEEQEKIRIDGPPDVQGEKYQHLIESGYVPKVSIRWVSKEVGYGLFAEEDLPENSYVGEYVGQIRKNNEHGELNHYLYKYPVLDEIGRNYVIDATCGNLLRFANHSFTFNMKHTYAFASHFYHTIFITIRPIVKGEQLTYNYGKNYWYLRGTPTAL